MTLDTSLLSSFGVHALLTRTEEASLTGASGDDTVDASGFSGRVTLIGGGGNDTLVGGSSSDSLDGGAGDDVLTGGPGNDTLAGGVGIDRLDELAQVNVVLTSTRLTGLGNDVIHEIERAWLIGGAGNNVLDAAGFTRGSVTLEGGGGNDRLVGTAAEDRLCGGPGTDSLLGGAGNDELDGGAGDDVLSGGLGDDTIAGGDGIDRITEAGDVDFTLTETSSSAWSGQPWRAASAPTGWMRRPSAGPSR